MNDDKRDAVKRLVDRVRAEGLATTQVVDGRVVLFSATKLRELLADAGDSEIITVFIARESDLN